MKRDLLRKIILHHRCRHIVKAESPYLKSLKFEQLTKTEWSEVKDLWGRLNLPINPFYFQMFKTLANYDCRYCPDDLFFPYILRALNRYEYSIAYAHKGMLPRIFANSKVRIPHTIINCINGVIYDGEGKKINKNLIKDILEKEQEFIIKPTTDTCKGRGVRKISTPADYDSVLKLYGNNFIIQEAVKQSSLTAVFNKPSLNTFRITTLYINGKATPCTILFKCGQGDVCIDNGGGGGIMIGVDDNGNLSEYGYNKEYKRIYKTINGLAFKGYTFPPIRRIADLFCELHEELIPHLGLAGWDVAIDEQQNPVLIEANLSAPGVQFEQLCPQTPIFGDRTSEVIEYVAKQKLIQFIKL